MHSRVKQSNLLLYTDDSTGKLLPTVEFDASGGGAIQKALSIARATKRFGVLSQNPATTTADKRLRHESSTTSTIERHKDEPACR